MTDFTEAPFSANFTMYGPDSLRVQFTCRSNSDPETHADLLARYLQTLAQHGYSATLPGLEAGEQTEEVDGWVLGETSKGDLCVFLYSVHHGLKWRIGTVYEERLNELPFTVDPNTKKWPGGAPEREPAERQGYMNTVTPFKIVMEETGEVTANGNPVKRFARVFDAAPAAPLQQPASRPPGPPQDVRGAAAPAAQAARRAQMDAENGNGGGNGANLAPPMPPDEMKRRFHALGNALYGDAWDDKRVELVMGISKHRNDGRGPVVKSSNELTRAEMQYLIDRMEAIESERKESAAA